MKAEKKHGHSFAIILAVITLLVVFFTSMCSDTATSNHDPGDENGNGTENGNSGSSPQPNPLLAIGCFFDVTLIRDAKHCTQYGIDRAEDFLIEKREKWYPTQDKWELRADIIRKQILVGSDLYDAPNKNSLDPIFGEVRHFDGYSVQNVAFESLPGVFVIASIYTPAGYDYESSIPGILSPHGHWTSGRYRADAQYRNAAMARMGAMVISYDMPGYGPMREKGWVHRDDDWPSTSRVFEILKIQLWNSIRTLDFLLAMGADPDNIGITGASGGASQSFLHGAVDDRIKVVVPVNHVSAHFYGGGSCETGMPIHRADRGRFLTNNVEIVGTIAPRPVLLVSNGDDWTRFTPEVEFPHVQHIYELMGHPENLENAHFPDERHTYNHVMRKAVYPFMAKHLGLDLDKVIDPIDGNLNEEGITIENQNAMYIFNEFPFPSHGITRKEDVVW